MPRPSRFTPQRPTSRKYSSYSRPNVRKSAVQYTEIIPKSRPIRKSKTVQQNSNSLNNVFKGFVVGDPFKPVWFTKLHYTSTHTMTVGASGVFGSIQKFRLNSLFDPDLTGGGDQPYAFDQMAALYSRYKVHGVGITVVLSDPDDDSVVLGCLISNPSDTTSIAGLTERAVREKPMAFTRTINNSGSQVVTVKTYLPMYQAFGVTKSQFNNDLDNSTAAVSGNPGTVPHIQFAVLDGRQGSAATVRLKIDFTFYSQFYQRVVQAQS